MSLVVAYKKDGFVYMGADTQSTSGTAIDRTLNASGFKITRLANGMLIGVCGRVKAHQLIVAQKKWFDIPDGETFDKQYIVKNIIPELSNLMKNVNEEQDTRNASVAASVLIAYRDRMFLITRQLNVYECGTYVVIGSGGNYAKYAISQITKGDDVNQGLLSALRAGARFDSTVSAPYILIDTKDKEYKIVEA